MKKSLIIMLLVWVSAMPVMAQQTHNLTHEEQEAFKIQCQERIDAFQMGLEIIADKQQNAEVKNHYINTLPEMFMGGGDPWTDCSGTRHAAVMMQVSSLSGKTDTIPLKTYLPRLRNLPYTSVELKKAQTCVMSNFYRMPDGNYMATCTFFQIFKGDYGDNRVYRDFTQKEVQVFISRVEDGALGSYWDMKFGNINVTETRKL